MLDWYFDCEGEQWSLRGLLTRDPSAALSAMKGAAAVKGAAAGGASATNPKLASKPKASATAVPAGSPPQKPERHTKANTADAGNVSIYHRFQGFLQVFRETIHKVRLEAPAETPGQGAAAVDGENFIWHRKDAFGLDSIEKPNVWLGLGRLEDGFRKPVAIKKNDEAEDSLRLKRIMRKLKPGSFIASAELVELEPLSMEVDEKQREDQTPKAQQMQKRWVSEAGVCTLEDIFGHSFPPNYDEERRTKAHRMLVREILHSMALAVYHLHECNIAHGTINLKYFKFFLIEEPPRSTNLRVKLVSMRRADILSPERQRADIQALGNAMARVVLGTQSSDTELLLPYDPSLYHLITWILQTDGDGATLADVVRHPYFMSLNEKEAFTLALEGGVFGQVATTADVSNCAFLPRQRCLLFNSLLLLSLLHAAAGQGAGTPHQQAAAPLHRQPVRAVARGATMTRRRRSPKWRPVVVLWHALNLNCSTRCCTLQRKNKDCFTTGTRAASTRSAARHYFAEK